MAGQDDHTDDETKVAYHYEIWQQKRGLMPQWIITLHDMRDVHSFLNHEAVKEMNSGMRVQDDGPGEFSTYVMTPHGKFHFASFWCEHILPEDGSGIDYEITKAVRYAEREAGNNPARYR